MMKNKEKEVKKILLSLGYNLFRIECKNNAPDCWFFIKRFSNNDDSLLHLRIEYSKSNFLHAYLSVGYSDREYKANFLDIEYKADLKKLFHAQAILNEDLAYLLSRIPGIKEE